MKSHLPGLVALVVVGAGIGDRSASAQPYCVTDLGCLPGGDGFTNPTAINASGQVVGICYLHTTTAPFLWESGRMTALPLLPGAGDAYARGINDLGQIVGYSSGPPEAYHAVLWDHGSLTDLGTLPGGRVSDAYDINNSGQVVGYATVPRSSYPNDEDVRAFLWDHGVMTDLGALADGDTIAYGINDVGQVVGLSRAGAHDHAFLWENGVMTDLGSLDGSFAEVGLDIDDTGTVVGVSTVPPELHAVVWEAGRIVDLGDLPGATDSQALGIDSRGRIVGTSQPPGHAFVWQDGVMHDLNDSISPASGWVLQSAFDINDSGQIVGGGRHGDVVAGFLLNPRSFDSVRAGNVNTGDSSCPASVLRLNDGIGDSNREMTVVAGAPCSLSISSAPSVQRLGLYALWIFDGATSGADEADIRIATPRGVRFDLGRGARILPVNNSDTPGACPCPVTFPTGMASRTMGTSRASVLCLNASPAWPKSPTAFDVVFPAGDFTIGCIVRDFNSINSPAKNFSIGNWLIVHSR
jgi:probable HAF family extracellular repeat protein